MKKLLIFILCYFLSISQTFASQIGRGELSIDDFTVSRFIEYIRGSKGQTPYLFIVSEGPNNWSTYFYCAAGFNSCGDRGGVAEAIKACEAETNSKCGIFARRRNIIWKNGINTATTINSKSPETEIIAKLTDLGFYDKSFSSNSIDDNASSSIGNDQIHDIKFNKCKLYEGSQFYNSFDINLKKKKIYNEFYAEGEIYKNTKKIIKNNEDEVVTKIVSWGTKKNQYHQYVFKKKNNEAYEILYKDKSGKELDEEILLFCEDVIGSWGTEAGVENKVEKNNLGSDTANQLRELKQLYDEGVITEDEFKSAKKKLLNL